MRRIGQAEMTQRVGHQQMTELVIHVRRGDGVMGKEQEPQKDGEEEQEQHAEAGFSGQLAPVGLDPAAGGQGKKYQESGQRQLDEIARAEAERILERLEGAEEIE